jgi:hypothetical protein
MGNSESIPELNFEVLARVEYLHKGLMIGGVGINKERGG